MLFRSRPSLAPLAPPSPPSPTAHLFLKKQSDSYTRQARLLSARNRHRRNTITRLFETSPAEMLAKVHATQQSDGALLRPKSEGSNGRDRSHSDGQPHRDSAPSRLSTVTGEYASEEGGGVAMGRLRGPMGSGDGKEAGMPDDIWADGEAPDRKQSGPS